MKGIVDALRAKVISDLMGIKTVKWVWPRWQAEIRKVLGQSPSARDVLELGSRLSAVFRTTGEAGRDQESLSAGGVAWESLVCWYLNLSLVGTNAVVVKKSSQVPTAIRDALTVRYGQVIANTESDLVAITFPEDPRLLQPLAPKEALLDRLSQVADSRLDEVRVTVVQCKTNWNDNAQVPMLWDMIYKAKFDEDTNIRVGVKNSTLRRLRYAFVTVPSNSNAVYESDSLCVRRVAQLSGGAYWGRSSKNAVALSLGEIFTGARIGPDDGRGVLKSLTEALPDLPTGYPYFNL